MSNLENKLNERMHRIGGKKRNFMLESQAEDMVQSDKIIVLNKKEDKGIENIDLILEPNKFDKLSTLCRLSFDEYCETINSLIEEEEEEWDELRMKDQVNITRDAIIQATMLKYAEEEYNIDRANYAGIDFNYIKRYAPSGTFIGEAIILTLTSIPIMGTKIN